MACRFGVTVLGAMLLAGCGGGAPDTGNASGGVSAGGGGATAASGWDGTKACDYLKQADVEAVTGQKSEPGKLEGVVPAANGGAAVSMCSYALADGRVVSLLTRVSDGQDLAPTVAAIKNPPPDYAMGTQVDLPGLGKAALWNEQMHQINFWLDGDHHGIITFANGDYSKRPDLSGSRDQAIALARRVGA